MRGLGLHASLTMLLLAVSHGYPLYEISKWVIYLQSNIHSEYVQSSWRNMSMCSWWHHESDISCTVQYGELDVGELGLLMGLWWRHNDVIKWKHFPRNWPFVRGIHRWPVNSPHKGQWRGALMGFFICTWINCWVNSAQAGDLRRHRAHYNVTLMLTGTHTCCQRNGMSIVHLTIVPDDFLNRLNYLKVADFDWYREHAYISDV